MDETVTDQPFRLSTGGQFYQLMQRLQLVEKHKHHPWRRIGLLTAVTWLPLAILCFSNGTLFGTEVDMPFLYDPEPHIRYLLALPVLVIAGIFIDSYMKVIVQHFRNSGLVPPDKESSYDRALKEFGDQRDAAWVDITLLGLSYGSVFLLKSTLILSTAHVDKSSWLLRGSGGVESLSLAGWWIIAVSAPLLLFLLLHWIWRYIIWINFIIKVSRIQLGLQPAHPDEVGGLGLLTGAQLSFGWIFMAVGTMMSSTLANEIIHAGSSLSDAKLEILGFVLISFAIITLPLCTFSSQLYKARRQGLKLYSELALQLTRTFTTNWIEDGDKDRGEKLITAVDPSAVADYSVIYDTIRGMGVFPLTRQKALHLALLLVIPFVPLLLTQFSLREALERLAQTLI